ncbi:MAG TPA: hypothetical protein VFO91_19080 [Anaerolineales bacterium]|nr:hypothetical protein [Anaerolineales bacterium]
MKRERLAFCTFFLLISSCTSTGTATPTAILSTPTPINLPTHTAASGNAVTLENLRLTIPEGLASDAASETVPAVTGTDAPPWEVAPAHTKITLTGYALEDKFHEPAIYVYPAEEFAGASSVAAEQIDRLRNLLTGSILPLRETLPSVPFFNAAPLIAAQIQMMPFQNGSGVRSLTQYAQYNAPVNNRELFYHFQGLTEDGAFYLVAVLPVSAPVLAEDESPEASVPAEGVPIPTDIGPNDVYYASITQKLNALSPDDFTPALDSLDALMNSILVTNP